MSERAADLAMIEQFEELHRADSDDEFACEECSRAPCDVARVLALAREAIEAREDVARLDWLERMANEPGGLLLHDGSESGRCGLGLRHGALTRTLREAVTTARGARDGTDYGSPIHT